MVFEGLSSQGYLKSATFANRDILDEGLDLRSGGSGALEIVMSANTAEVSGTVRNEKGDPAPGSRVTLIPVKDRVGVQNASRYGTSDQMGSFRMSGVPPGEYKIWAWEQLEFGLDQVPEFRRQFESSAVTVKVAEKASESVALKMIATDAVERAKEKLP